MRLGTAISVSVIAFAAFTAPAAAQSPCPGNPNALGLARTVEVDTTGGPGFGFEQYKAHDFLVLNEVVLTFDDGPWPGNTTAVLAALAHHCTKATFFPVGKHALWHPEILKQVAAGGHTIGGHTWSHPRLCAVHPDEARYELATSRDVLEQSLGRPVVHLAYPFGSVNATVRTLAAETGYSTACTTEIGVSASGEDLLMLRRVPITGHDSLMDFVCRVRTGLTVVQAAKALARRTQEMVASWV